MSENKQLDRVKEITDQLEAGIHDLFESERYQQWLTTMSRFHNYSLNNTMLIAMQKPEATLVAGYTAWQKQFGRQVQKGEKGIKILAPAPYKEMVEMDKIDPDTRLPVLDENGDPVKEEQEVTRPAYKVVSVFDVSQTDGKELPTIGVNELTGDVERYEQFFEALKLSCPVPMEFENIQGGAKGYYHQTDKRIAIQEGMSQLQTVKTAIHEMAHQKLHSMENDLTKNSKEVEAESVAYTVCQHFGIDTSDYSFGYIAGWSEGKETPELKASLQTIRNAAKEIINDIEGHLMELTKENDIEKDAEDLAVKLDRFAYDYDYYGYQDAVDDPEESVLQTKHDLLSNENIDGIREYLQEIISEDDTEYVQKAEALLDEINSFAEKYHGQKISEPAKEEPEAKIRFYVAECMEFTNYGQYFETNDLKEAYELYQKIPAERLHAIKGIGFILEDGSNYSGAEWPILEGGRLARDQLEYVEHYKNSPLVQQAFQEMEKILCIEEVRSEEGTYLFDGDKYLDMHLTDTGAWDYTLYDKGFREIDGGQLGENGSISLDDAKFQILGMHGYKDVFVMDTDKEKFEENQADISGKTYLSDNQKDYIGDVILQGFDPKEYWVNGSTIDLTGRYFSDDELSDIKYQVKVDAIPKTLYSPEQWKVIEKGISEKLDVSMYAYPSMTADQMEMTRRALIAEDKGYISREDLSVISDGSHSAEEMKQMLKEAMHTEIKAAQPVQQENGMYRYYSTQRPVAPGTFPKENGNPVDIKNYDERIDIPAEGLKAWGYVEYEKPLTEKQASDYELKPAVKVETREKSAENSSHDRRSVLADLNAKKAIVSGSKIPKETRNKSKEEQL